MFAKTLIAAAAIATAAAGAATAQSATSQGSAMLAANAGVAAGAYSDAQLVRLIQAQRSSNDSNVVSTILDAPVAVVSRTEPGLSGNRAASRDQYAASIGVDADDFSLPELVRLNAAADDGDRYTVRRLLDAAGVDIPVDRILR